MNTIETPRAESAAVMDAASWAAAGGGQRWTAEPSLRHSTVADYIHAAVAPYVSADLVSPAAMANINVIGSLLPGALTDFFGFECPLGIHEPKADFLVCSRASEGGRDVLIDQRPGRELPAFFEQHPVWRRIRGFAREWSDLRSPLFEGIHNIWIEFDVDGTPAILPVPSVFIGSDLLRPGESGNLESPLQHCAWLMDLALPLLLGCDLDPCMRLRVARCLNLLPAGARIFQVGLMLGRASRITRLCVRGLSSNQIPEYLHAVGWQGSLPEVRDLVNLLAPLVERIDLDIDVGDRVLPKIGLECYPAQSLPAIQRFLDYLVSSGLSTATKAEGLKRWAGLAHERLTPDVWPRDLLALSAFLEGRVHSAFFRWLHHIKVVHQPGLPAQAKAYLAVHHHWIAPADLKQIFYRAAGEQRSSGGAAWPTQD